MNQDEVRELIEEEIEVQAYEQGWVTEDRVEEIVNNMLAEKFYNGNPTNE